MCQNGVPYTCYKLFEKYGINPVEHESPAQEMQKLIKRMDQVFAFLKKQETDLVRPACEALAGASTQITISLSSLLSEESSGGS